MDVQQSLILRVVKKKSGAESKKQIVEKIGLIVLKN
jgi:hypothetical protein